MGTRADFYVGRGPKAEWIGSVAWDGYPCGLSLNKNVAADSAGEVPVLIAKTEEEYRSRVKDLLNFREDGTFPEDGWPWPWENSNTTDYSYAFDGGMVYGTAFGHGWWEATKEPEEQSDDVPKIADSDWPDMKPKQKVTFGKRSGVLVFSAPAR